jgi:hypothetical protein
VVWWRQNERHPETYLLHASALAAVRVYGVPGGGIMNEPITSPIRGCLNSILISVPLWLVIILLITQCACGVVADLPTVQPTEAVGHITETVVSANVESVNTEIHMYTTTAPLHIRSCASIGCDVVAYLDAGSSVDVKWNVAGPGCAGADWYAIDWQGWTGFVCSLYVEAR